MSSPLPSSSSTPDQTTAIMPFRIVYERDFKRNPTKAQFILLNGLEAGYTNKNFVINKVITPVDFCMVGFTNIAEGVNPERGVLVAHRVSLPKNHYPNFIPCDLHKKLLPLEFFIAASDGTLNRIETADTIILDRFTDDQEIAATSIVTKIFTDIAEKTQKEESTLSSSELSSRVTKAPVTPKSKGGFFSRLFGKPS
jgi:hypothetical protein